MAYRYTAMSAGSTRRGNESARIARVGMRFTPFFYNMAANDMSLVINKNSSESDISVLRSLHVSDCSRHY